MTYKPKVNHLKDEANEDSQSPQKDEVLVEINEPSHKTDATPEELKKELESIETELLALLDKVGTLSIERKVGKAATGISIHAASTLILTVALPQLGVFNGAIGGLIGAATNMTVDKFLGDNRSSYPQTAVRFFDSIGVNGGSILLSSLLAQGNITAEVALTAILPAVIQTNWFMRHSEGTSARLDLIKIKDLMAQHVEIANELGIESPFQNIIEQKKPARPK